ncbi:MAG: type III pantothenate kinase [Bacteroidales bacterium]
MYLIIDIGNSFHKAAVFSEIGEMVYLVREPILTKSHFVFLFEQFDISNAILATVGVPLTDILGYMPQRCKSLLLTAETKIPIQLNYNTINTLGVDRIANAVAVNSMYRDQNVLSVQVGSCIVFDFINSYNEYLGGSISPGIEMRFKALHHFTQKLPLIEKAEIDFLVGTTTQDSILSGVMNGVQYEIEGMIAQYEKLYHPIKLIITGGNDHYLQKSIKNAIFAGSNLVLIGLYKILKLNVTKE